MINFDDIRNEKLKNIIQIGRKFLFIDTEY